MFADRHKRSSVGFLYALLLIFAAIFVVFELILPREAHTYTHDTEIFDVSWSRVLSDGTRMPIAVPYKGSCDKGTPLVLEAVLPTIDTDKSFICFRGSQQNCRIYVDDILRHEYNTSATRIFPGSSPSAYILCELGIADSGRVIRIELISNTHFSGTFNEVRYGNEFDLWLHIIRANLVELGIDIFMLLLGILVLVGGMIIHFRAGELRMLELLGLVITAASLITFTESLLRQLFFPNVSVVADLSYYLIGLALMALIAFIDEVQGHRYKYSYMVLTGITFLDLIANFVMAYFGVMELFNSMWLTMGYIVIVLIIFVINIFRDIHSGDIRSYKDIMLGLLLFCASIMLGNLLVNVIDVMDSVGIFIALGVCLLLSTVLHRTVKEVVALDRSSHKALYDKELKEKLFASISHDIRTPINGVMGMDETILKESSDPQVLECARSIMTSSKMILSLVNDLLDFSRAEAGSIQIIPRSYRSIDLLSDSIGMIEESAAAKELKLNLDIDPNLPAGLVGDDLRIRQILINLLSNAVKYTTEGSITLFVTLINDDRDRTALRLTVRDTGRGIHEEDIPRLFDTFSRLEEGSDRAIAGTGLGLSITKCLIDLMDGRIVVESEYGKGSVFTCLIPQTVEDYTPLGDFNAARAARITGSHDTQTAIVAPEAHILVVDDNPINLTVMKNLLKPSGSRVELVADGEMAVDLCRCKHFDLIFMDHMMPGMNGTEALSAIREDHSGLNTETPVIALTANETLGSCDMYKRYGFTDFLPKPVSSDMLNRMLKTYLPKELTE